MHALHSSYLNPSRGSNVMHAPILLYVCEVFARVCTQRPDEPSSHRHDEQISVFETAQSHAKSSLTSAPLSPRMNGCLFVDRTHHPYSSLRNESSKCQCRLVCAQSLDGVKACQRDARHVFLDRCKDTILLQWASSIYVGRLLSIPTP